jgi:TatD DNase family protein
MTAYSGDIDRVIAAADQAGVSRIISIGINLESSRAAVALADRYPGVYAAVGVHPHHASETGESWYRDLRQLARHPKVVAYGEVGLDFVKQHAPLDVQMKQFKQQVRIAKELSLPLIIHDREAHAETMNILKKESPFPAGGVMHCFSGDMNLAEEVMALGFYISIPGIVTYNTAEKLREVVRQAPLAVLLLETDGPFLSPVPERGKRNEPAFLLHTAGKIAELKETTLARVAEETTKNAKALFSLT